MKKWCGHGLDSKKDEILILCIKRRRMEEYLKSIFKVEIKATEWAFETIRESFEKVAKDEAGRLNIVQGIVEEYQSSRHQKDCAQIVGFNWEEALQWVGAQAVEKKMEGDRPTGYWWYKKVTVPVRLRCSKRMRRRKVCVKTRSMRSSCWQTSRKMVTARFRVLFQAFVK